MCIEPAIAFESLGVAGQLHTKFFIDSLYELPFEDTLNNFIIIVSPDSGLNRNTLFTSYELKEKENEFKHMYNVHISSWLFC